MAKYRVEVAYRTKRECVLIGMTVEAADADEAQDIGERKVLKGRPARVLDFTTVKKVLA